MYIDDMLLGWTGSWKFVARCMWQHNDDVTSRCNLYGPLNGLRQNSSNNGSCEEAHCDWPRLRAELYSTTCLTQYTSSAIARDVCDAKR